mmetsp:Transcript_49980/g.116789  ORF Transcript_49980/g.116789 Transcript_49980/m.116789 type:complete len:264 (-) Transcript_49980:529-1320(-)
MLLPRILRTSTKLPHCQAGYSRTPGHSLNHSRRPLPLPNLLPWLTLQVRWWGVGYGQVELDCLEEIASLGGKDVSSGRTLSCAIPHQLSFSDQLWWQSSENVFCHCHQYLLPKFGCQSGYKRGRVHVLGLRSCFPSSISLSSFSGLFSQDLSTNVLRQSIQDVLGDFGHLWCGFRHLCSSDRHVVSLTFCRGSVWRGAFCKSWHHLSSWSGFGLQCLRRSSRSCGRFWLSSCYYWSLGCLCTQFAEVNLAQLLSHNLLSNVWW